MQWKERVWGWMSIKQKVWRYLGRKVVFWKWILVVSVVSGLVVIPFSVPSVRVGFIVVILMCLGRWVHYHVGMSLSLSTTDVLEEVEKFCNMGDMISCYASEAVSSKIGSAWKKFRDLIGVWVGKQGLYSKQQGKIYQCCVRPVYCCETCEFTVAEEARFRRVKRTIIRMMYWVRLIDRMSTDVLRDMVSVVVKIDNTIIESRLRWYGHVMHGDIKSQICKVMEVEITGKRKIGWPRKSWEECVKKDLQRYGLRREDTFDRKKWRALIRAKKFSLRPARIMALKRTLLFVVDKKIVLLRWNHVTKVPSELRWFPRAITIVSGSVWKLLS